MLQSCFQNKLENEKTVVLKLESTESEDTSDKEERKQAQTVIDIENKDERLASLINSIKGVNNNKLKIAILTKQFELTLKQKTRTEKLREQYHNKRNGKGVERVVDKEDLYIKCWSFINGIRCEKRCLEERKRLIYHFKSFIDQNISKHYHKLFYSFLQVYRQEITDKQKIVTENKKEMYIFKWKGKECLNGRHVTIAYSILNRSRKTILHPLDFANKLKELYYLDDNNTIFKKNRLLNDIIKRERKAMKLLMKQKQDDRSSNTRSILSCNTSLT